MANSTIRSEMERKKKLEAEIKGIDINVREIKKNNLINKQIFLGKALLRKVKEKPDYQDKIISLINEYSTDQEKKFFNMLQEEDRLF